MMMEYGAVYAYTDYVFDVLYSINVFAVCTPCSSAC